MTPSSLSIIFFLIICLSSGLNAEDSRQPIKLSSRLYGAFTDLIIETPFKNTIGKHSYKALCWASKRPLEEYKPSIPTIKEAKTNIDKNKLLKELARRDYKCFDMTVGRPLMKIEADYAIETHTEKIHEVTFEPYQMKWNIDRQSGKIEFKFTHESFWYLDDPDPGFYNGTTYNRNRENDEKAYNEHTLSPRWEKYEWQGISGGSSGHGGGGFPFTGGSGMSLDFNGGGLRR